MAVAIAHPNIALVKYWGKQDGPGNIPATPSLSITLSGMTTTTTVDDSDVDQLILNGASVSDAKVTRFLETLRAQYTIGPLRISSDNDFPTSAGLASSASGFAALATAINAHCTLELDVCSLSAVARQGSASAARSMLGGFVALAGPDWQAKSVAIPEHWDLRTAVAITSDTAKTISSSEGMMRTQTTSPYYPLWGATTEQNFTTAAEAVAARDFERLAEVAEASCLQMHALMLTSKPALAYWNPTTIECMDTVRSLREAGHRVFFTIDAGPQVKAVCEPASLDAVTTALRSVPGVIDVISCALGRGAETVDSS